MNVVLLDFGTCTVVSRVKVLQAIAWQPRQRDPGQVFQLLRATGPSYLGFHLALRLLEFLGSTAIQAATI
jgi:hypothetical protein